jgi:hypothetical protein
MQENISQPAPSVASLMVWVCAALTLVWGDVSFGLVVKEDLIAGRILSPAVVFGVSQYYYQSSSPIMYRLLEGIYIMGFIIVLVVAIFGLFVIVRDHKRRVAEQKKEK